MLWIDFDYFSDEDNCFKTGHTSLFLKDQERAHEWSNKLRNSHWVLLGDSIDTFD